MSIDQFLATLSAGCGNPECPDPDCGKGVPLVMNPQCHPGRKSGRGVEVVIDPQTGVLHLHCFVCHKLVVAIQLRNGGMLPDVLRVH